MLWIKTNAKLLCCVLSALVLGLAAGYWLHGLGTQIKDQTEEPAPIVEAKPASAVGEISILPETQVCTRYIFTLCGHEVERLEFAGELTGCTKNDVLERVPNSAVIEFSADRALIEREMPSYCPEHFLLKLDGDSLKITHTDSVELENEETQVLSYEVSSLPEEALILLREGCVFDDLEGINAFLEDVES